MSEKPFAPATARNQKAILDIIATELVGSANVLEIGSGTGQHAVYFGKAMPHLLWQTSDVAENHAGIEAWLAETALPNVRAPLDVDVRTASVEAASYDAVYSANTAHIMGFSAVEDMFAMVGTALRDNGVFILYGPFRQNGAFNTQSNAAFHATLTSTSAEMGIRDLESLDQFASASDLHRERLYAMPANNHIVIWRRGARSES